MKRENYENNRWYPLTNNERWVEDLPEEFPNFDPSEYFITREQNKGHICYYEEKKDKVEEEKNSQEAEAKEE